MSILHVEMMCDEITEASADEARGYTSDGLASARISNADAENGYPTSGPLSWLNSARVETDLEHDRVLLTVSVGDPRGCFCFEVYRTNEGRLLIHMPYPGEPMPHCETKRLSEGTLVVVSESGEPINFSDPEEDEDEEDEGDADDTE